MTLYINVALKRLEDCRTLAEGTKAIINLGNENVPVPGEKGFPFPWLFSSTKSQKEAGKWKMKDVLYAIENLYLWLQFFIAVVTVPLDSGRITKQGAIRLLSIRFWVLSSP